MPSNPNRNRFLLVWLIVLLAAAPAASQETSRRAVLHLRLPAEARLSVEGRATKQTGSVRHFYSPTLKPGKSYHYTFEWTYHKDGKTYKVTKRINVYAGLDRQEDLSREKGKEVGAEEKKPVQKATRKLDVHFVPTPREVVDKMLEMAQVKEDDVVYDLGCGDGRIVIAAAKKYKCKAVGFDLDDDRVREARAKVKAEGLEDLVTIEKKDLFEVDLKPARVVTLYLLPELNERLLPQLKQLKPGSRIVSHEFEIKGYPPKQSANVNVEEVGHSIYLWQAPLKK